MDRKRKIALILLAVGIALIVAAGVLQPVEIKSESGVTSKPFTFYGVPLFVIGLALIIVSVGFFYRKSDEVSVSALERHQEPATSTAV
jgi:hypothetical protein